MAEQVTTVETPEIIVTITGGNEVVTVVNDSSIQIVSISSEGPMGPMGPTGQGVPAGGLAGQVLSKIDGTDYNTQWVDDTDTLSWIDVAGDVEYTGVETSIASGTVYECTIDATTIYRFVNSTNNANGYPIEDSFYSDFDGTNLTNLLATRGV